MSLTVRDLPFAPFFKQISFLISGANFSVTFIRKCYWTVIWARKIQCLISCPISLRPILILSSYRYQISHVVFSPQISERLLCTFLTSRKVVYLSPFHSIVHSFFGFHIGTLYFFLHKILWCAVRIGIKLLKRMSWNALGTSWHVHVSKRHNIFLVHAQLSFIIKKIYVLHCYLS
jgi:hypothetical protein